MQQNILEDFDVNVESRQLDNPPTIEHHNHQSTTSAMVPITLQIIADCRLIIQQEVKRMKGKALIDIPLSNSEGNHLQGLLKTLAIAEDLERKQHIEQLTDSQLGELLTEVMKYEATPIARNLLPQPGRPVGSGKKKKKKTTTIRGRG